MKKVTVLIDMDDVMNELLEAWVHYLNSEFYQHKSISKIKSWNMRDSFPTLTDYEIYSCLEEEWFWKKVKPKEGGPEYIRKLKEEGYRIVIVTATHFNNVSYKIQYIINRYYPFIEWRDIIISQEKQLIRGNVLIDDGIHNLIGGKYKGILFDAPHNKDIELPKDIQRVHDWKECYELIHKLFPLK